MYILPKPQEINEKQGCFYVSFDGRIVLDSKVKEGGMVCARLLFDCMKKWTGYEPAIVKGIPAAKDIYLTVSDKVAEDDKAVLRDKKQAYYLAVSPEGITIKGSDRAGLLYGVQSLCQIIEQCGAVLPCLEIMDYPDIQHRGYYFDQTRGRVLTLDALKKLADKLCRYKINELQLYVEHTYLFSGFSEMWRDETPLTAEEIMELDAYCRERSIELIPSLSSFGHLYTLLSTKSYGELCELENSWQQPFSFLDRMRHHTVNVTDERVLPLIKGMLEEYLNLFTTDKFNFCADETFDLGKGKASALAEEKGVHRIYIDYMKELCDFLVKKGKIPMFWGDVIGEMPELIKELPEQVVCLTWGYAPDQRENESRKMAELGANQYLCPGVQGWNHWINRIEDAYKNIRRMCSYAHKYAAMGVLNTDWGDYGHVNCPEYSVPGMIFGGAFSWNQEMPEFEEICRQVSVTEYHDASEKLVELLCGISECAAFDWFDAVIFYEKEELGEQEVGLTGRALRLDQETAEEMNAALERLNVLVKESARNMDSCSREILQTIDMTVQGLMIWNEIGALVMENRAEAACGDKMMLWKEAAEGLRGCGEGVEKCEELAARLEIWFMHYKSLWRRSSREGDLHHVAEIIFWYADLLRGRNRQKKRI